MKILLAGNPNCGKTSLFNQLTGLNQKVGNYPGITVEKRTGHFLYENEKVEVTDLPGIYSLYPGSEDERIAVSSLLNIEDQPPFVVCLIDILTPHKNLLLLSQLVEFGLPLIAVLNYRKKSTEAQIQKWKESIEKKYQIPTITLNANSGKGIENLRKTIVESKGSVLQKKENTASEQPYSEWIATAFRESSPEIVKRITKDLREKLEDIDNTFVINLNKSASKKIETSTQSKSSKLDAVLMHPFLGYLIFGGLLLLIFQAVFSWSEYPMDLIENGFGLLSSILQSTLPSNFYTDALTNGVIPGLAGVVIFVPQIAFLFLFIAIFEESGYMSRVVYLMDRLVKPFGLSGKSVVPLISGYACAIPAIMSTRTIKHPRERLITMLVIPFMTCSARIPVYTTLIALMVSADAKLGIFNLQGIILFGLYFFGAFMSFFIALISNKILSGKGRSLLLMELPNYKIPALKSLLYTMYEKSKSFVLQAGKVILLVSLLLYFMANLGFNETYQKIENNDPTIHNEHNAQEVAKLKLENSLIGELGKAIEPAIRPLGYDWKIGISLITSFAAREVFVGTMSTIYALEDAGDDSSTIVSQMRNDRDENGLPKYSLAVILSLLVFYALAMQCLGTVAVMRKETGGWKWPSIQFVVASGSAYVLAFVVFQIFK